MATRKPAVPADEKFENTDLDMFEVLAALDRKDYEWYGKLTDEQQKKFVPYITTHWMSAVKAKGTMGAYYVMSTDFNANKHLFNERVQQHPELQWLMLCAASPGSGKQFHQWIPHLNSKFALLKERAAKKDYRDYFSKVFAGLDAATLDEYATEFTQQQQLRYRLSKMYPEMKIQDIETLSKCVTDKELDQYEKDSGN